MNLHKFQACTSGEPHLPGGIFLNRTTHARSPGRAAAFAAAATLLLAALPLGALAANEAGEPDGFVVVARPRGATLQDGAAIVTSVGGQYVFDFALYTATGQPYVVTEYMVDVNTLDAEGNNGPATKLIYTARVATAPASAGTIRIPAEFLTWQAEAVHGVVLTILATKDANGAPLHDGHYPAGQYSLVANELAAQGKWAEADQADEGFTPIFVVDAQPMGLLQSGNPLLNPGFEVGSHLYDDVAVPAGEHGFSGAVAPWFLRVDEGDHVPHSTHHRGERANDGTAGSHVVIHYDTRDNGRNLYFGQLIGHPDAGGPSGWKGGSAVTVEYDVRLVDDNAKASSFAGTTTIHWGDSSQLEARSPAGGVPVDGRWHHVRVDYGASLDGKPLNAVFLSLDDAFPAGSAVRVSVDNFVLRGAVYTSGHNPRNDLVDGYTALLQPVATSYTQGADVAARLVGLAGGQTGYLLGLGAVDYTSGRAEVLDLADTNYVTVKLLDETFVKSGKGVGQAGPDDVAFYAQTTGANADRILRTVDGAWFVVAPGALAGKALVPWMFADVRTGDTYAPTYGAASEPVSGYYSATRNNLAGWSVADHLDYAFTPLALTDQAGPSMASPAQVRLTCPAIEAGGSCIQDPLPTLKLTLESGSPFVETLDAKLVSRVDPGLVLGTGTLATPSGEVSFPLGAAKLDALRATGDMTVMAIVSSGLFTEGVGGPLADGSNVFRLDNLAPIVDFTVSPSTGVTRDVQVTLADASRDTDGTYTREWKVWFVSDATPDLVEVDAANALFQGTGATLSFNLPDDGLYRADLRIRDNDGVEATKSVEIAAGNVAPHAAFNGPGAVRAGAHVNYTDASFDSDGGIVKREWDTGSGWTPVTPVLGKVEIVFPETSGQVVVGYRVTDDDGVVTTTTRTIVVDAEVPVTTVTIPAANGLNGWHKTPPQVVVSRTDAGGAGLRETSFTDNGVPSKVAGSGSFARTITGDGVHAITVFSVDMAGNAEAPQTYTVKLDTSAPTVAQRAHLGEDIGGAVMRGDTFEVSAAASDPHSPVAKVVFQLVGGAVIGADTDGADGYSASWDTDGLEPGVYEIDAIAHNDAGLFSASRLRYVVYGAPASPVDPPADADGDKVPDEAEVLLCSRDDPATVLDGTCAGDDWTAPEATEVLAEILSHAPSDADGDLVPDVIEAALCEREDPATAIDGSCAGGDYAIPDPGQVVQELLSKLPPAPDSPDADGDKVPDAAEPALCEHEDPALASDGSCSGSDYAPPAAEEIAGEAGGLLPPVPPTLP